MNISNITFQNTSFDILQKSCWTTKDGINGIVDTECILKTFCSQLDHYYVRTGLLIIITVIVSMWFTNWFFNIGYKKINWQLYDSKQGLYYPFACLFTLKLLLNLKFIYNPEYVDLRKLEGRIYLYERIADWRTILCILFITIIVYLNW